jgi:hypothetical protein
MAFTNSSPPTSVEKTSVEQHDDTTIDRLPKEEQIRRIDALATSQGAATSFSDIDEKRILRKMDLKLLPILTVLYLMSFLDRGNIGNAKIEGLTDDLKISGE